MQTSYLPLQRFPGLDEANFEDNSLYDRLETSYAVRLFEAVEVLRMGSVTVTEAKLLGVKPGSGAFVLERYTSDSQGPFEFVLSKMRGDRYQIRMRLPRTGR